MMIVIILTFLDSKANALQFEGRFALFNQQTRQN